MQTATVQYKLIKKIKDEQFDEDLIHQYYLLINIGSQDLQTGVIDSASNRMLLLEDYVLPNITSHEDQLLVLEQIFDAHALLKAGFWKQIKVCIKGQKFVQVPAELFEEDKEANYLQFNAAIDEGKEACLSIRNPLAEAVTTFAVFRDMKEWLARTYTSNKPVFLHQSASLIEGILNYSKKRNDSPLYIYIDRFRLHIVFCKDGKLVYYNQFAIKQFSDYVRYIMLVMKSLDMDQASSNVVLWGYLGKNSPHYNEFYKYINNVSFGARPDYLQFSYLFDEIQDHHFFDLYSIHLLGNNA